MSAPQPEVASAPPPAAESSFDPPPLGATAPVALAADEAESEAVEQPPTRAPARATPPARSNDASTASSRTALDGSLHRPRVQRPTEGAPAWSTPPWLSERAGNDPNPVSRPDASASPPAGGDHAAYGANTQASIENVALRMQRIKASAAAVRDAVAAEIHEERTRAERPHPPAPQPEPEPIPARPAAAAAPPASPMADAPMVQRPARPAPARADAPGTGREVHVPRAAAPIEEVVAPAPRALPSRPAAGYAEASGAFDTDDPGDADDGFFDDDEDEYGDDYDSMVDGEVSGFGDVVSARPLPWRPIAIGGGAVLLIGIIGFGFMTSNGEDSDTTQDDAGEIAEADPVQAEPSETKAVPEAGQPVQPQEEAEEKPDEAAPVAVALDEASKERLEHARDLYDGASGGSRRKKLAEASEILQEILAKHPTQDEALLLLAQVLLEQGDAETSLTTAAKCTTVAPQQADCWLTIGVLEQDRNNKAEAVTAYEKYLALAPDGRYAGEVQKQLNRLR